MDELMRNKEYHIAYVLGTEFENRMFDVYRGMGTSERPPYIDDIFTETSQMQSLILLESIRSQPETMGLTEHEWNELHKAVWENDEFAKTNVLMMVSKNEVDNVAHDIFHYLYKYRMCTLMKQDGVLYSKQAKLLHSPYTEVW